MISKILLFFFLALGMIRPVLASWPAQNAIKQPQLKYDVSVTMKLIQVYVLDKNGQPVKDLDPSDFEVISNHKSQKIVAFERHVLPAEEASVQEMEQPEDQKMSRKFFFLFDFAFNDSGGIVMSKKTAVDFLETYALPTDEIGIISYSVDNGLTLHEYLTRDHAKIRELIKELGSTEAKGRAGAFLEELVTEKTAKMDRQGSEGMAEAAREAFKRGARAQSESEILKFASSLKDLASGLRYLPGIKHIVLFSKGPPNFLMYQRADQIAPVEGIMNMNASSGLHLRVRYESMLLELASANSPVIAVNVEGLSSRFRDMNFKELSKSARPSLNGSPSGDFIERNMIGDSALIEMARLSGGKYFGGMNDYQKISREIQDLTGSFYVLGFMVPEKWDGKYEKVEVKVRRGGCDVYSQKGYFNPKPFAKYSAFEKQLQLIDLALSEKSLFSEPLRFPMTALAKPADQGNALVLLAGIPVIQMRRPSQNVYELFMLVFDQEKNLVGQQRMEFDASKISDEAVFSGSFSDVSSGRFECRVVMRNLETGKGAVASSAVDVPRRNARGFTLFPPLLLVPREKPVSVLGPLFDSYAFDPVRQAPLIGGMNEGTKTVSVLLPCAFSQFEGTDIVFKAQSVDLESGDRKWLPLTITGHDQQNDTITYRLDLQTDGLAAGEYSLYFFAEDPGKRFPSAFSRASLVISSPSQEP